MEMGASSDAGVGGPFWGTLEAEVARAHLAAIVESSEDAILGMTLEGVITNWNPGAERLYGYAAAEVVGQSICVLIPPEHSHEPPALLGRLKRGERVEHHEILRVRKDGRRLDVSLSLSPIRDGAGRLVGAAAIARDMAERRRAEETERAMLRARAAAEARFRGVVEAAPDAVLLISADGRIALVNAQAESLFGYQREELLGQPLELLVPERFRQAHVHQRAAYAAAPRTQPMGSVRGHRCRRRDGGELPVDISLSPLETEEGLLIIAAIRDVTERERLLAAEQAARQEAEALAELARLGTTARDSERAIRLVTERSARLLGADLAGVIRVEPGGGMSWHGAWGQRAKTRWTSEILARSPAWQAAATRRTVLVERLGENPDYPLENLPVLRGESIRTALFTPLTSRLRTLGALVLGWRTDHHPDEGQQGLVEALAGHAAGVLDNAWAHAEARRYAHAATERASALAAAEERLRQVYHAVACGVLVRDATGTIVDANAYAEEILGLSAAQMHGRTPEELWPSAREDGQPFGPGERPSEVALRTGQPVRHAIQRITRSDGQHRWVQTDAVPLLDADGRPSQVVTSFIDISPLKE